MSGERVYRFSAHDTWFFRESRPFGVVGGTELGSVFPPPARMVAGAIRTLIGNQRGVDWSNYCRSKGESVPDLRKAIGFDGELGQLVLRGPCVERTGQVLFPAPLSLMCKGHALYWLKPGSPVSCDLGRNVLLPQLSADIRDGVAKPVEQAWLTCDEMARVLAGGTPDVNQLIWTRPKSRRPEDIREALLSDESRIGLARNYRTRTAEPHMLYQTRHLRPAENVRIACEVGGIEADWHPGNGMLRLGGEGRPSEVDIREGELPRIQAPTQGNGLFLVLRTPALFQKGNWLPDGFEQHGEEQRTVWRGVLNGIQLTLISAVVGRPVREGGWSLTSRGPRACLSLVPAGSVYFFDPPGDWSAAVTALHHKKIGQETELGRGEVLVGTW